MSKDDKERALQSGSDTIQSSVNGILIPVSRFESMHEDLVHVTGALRIAKWLFGALGAMSIGGVLWTNASIATINARLKYVEQQINQHAVGEGHTKSIHDISQNRADIRVLQEGVYRRLESIESTLQRLERERHNNDF